MKSSELPIPYGWYAVEYIDELAVGEVKPLHFFGKDLVIFRTESGKAVLLDAYCPHLGAHLGHGGEVHGESIACPFHGWEFDGAGMCTKVPYAKNMPAKIQDSPCIEGYPIVEANRVIWAWYHPRNIAPLFDVDILPQVTEPGWTDCHRFEWEINTCLQETGENGVDIAHFVYVHSSIEMPEAHVELSGHHRITTMHSRTPAIDENGVIDASGENWEQSRLVTTSCGPGMTYQSFERMFTSFMLGTITPIEKGKVLMRWTFAQPEDQSDIQKMYSDGMIAEIARQVGQDIPIWEHKIYQPNPILCDGDGPIAKYRKWFNQFYDGGMDDAPIRLVQ